MTDFTIAPQEYAVFRAFLEEACGIMLGDNKHYLVSSRLQRVMREFGITTFGVLLEQLKHGRHPQLRARIIDAMTTNETLWFRDGHPFELLRQHILPELAKQRTRPCRIWSAACSSGQEPYSIAMTLAEYQGANPGSFAGGVQIVATDISPSMLRACREGTYDSLSMARGLSEERRRRFFVQHGERWEVRPELRSRITFTELNLMQSYASLGKFDIIYCRNVLIYFSAELKRDILNRMAQTLHPQGFLMLGGSEATSGYTDAYQMVRAGTAVYYRRKV